MPRLTVHEFIKRHHLLRILWLDDLSREQLFALLSVYQQWELHDCYRPADTLSDDELGARFRSLQQKQPNLILQAGRHYAVIHRAYVSDQVVTRSVAVSRRQVRVRFIARPHIDQEALVAALAMLASRGSVVDEDAVK